MANLVWSYPTLELRVDVPLFPAVREAMVPRVAREVAHALEKLTSRPVTIRLAAEVAEFTNSLLEFAWSFSFADEEMGALATKIQEGLLEIAIVMDKKCSSSTLIRDARPAGDEPKTPQGSHRPRIILDLPGIVAVLKPPHWEVDARVGGTPSTEETSGAPMLSGFLRRTFSADACPLIHCKEQQWGIIHRLDTPSSGLILAGKSFQGYFTLRWQLDTYELGREYLVLLHGWMPWGAQVINAKIRTSRSFPVCSMVSEEGKPAWTKVEPLLVVERAESDEVFTLVAIMIRTGRTHQIRVHTKYIGHPTVTDGKYTDLATYDSDRKWCPRNFLHRFRLTFTDTCGHLREALAPLPDDLKAVLQTLCPIDERSARVMRDVFDGWVPNAGLA